MNPDPDKVWERFMLRLSLELHDGKVVEAMKRPAKNFHGSAEEYKKHYDRAVADIRSEDMEKWMGNMEEMSSAMRDGEFDVGGEG